MYIPNKQDIPVGATFPTAWGFVFILKSDKHPDFAAAMNRYHPTAFEQAFPLHKKTKKKHVGIKKTLPLR